MGPSQIPSLSVSGSSGSVPVSVASTYRPVSVSFTSSKPSPSSSSSSTRGGTLVELPSMVSGIPSPSVSVSADESSGKASGPAVHTPPTALGPSHIPSPSVSGLLGFVPSFTSSASNVPSASSSRSSTSPGESGLFGS